jgi:Protein of unknown function (DUF1360)
VPDAAALTPDPWFRFLLAVLATWRVTHLLASEDGPADVVVRVRAMLGRSMLGALLDCFYCLSFWVAAPLAFTLASRPVPWVVAWLALSGGACLLEARTAAGAPTVTDNEPKQRGQ